MFIQRHASEKLLQLCQQFKAVAVVGPRQSGKTTLVRACFPEKPYVSLENPQPRSFAIEDPVQFLRQFPQGAILDEIQRVPELFSYLQQILDENPQRGQFILSGSNNFLLLETITQTLAGRVAYLDLLPFSLSELRQIPDSTIDLNTCLLRGAYPEIWTEKIIPSDWFSAYVRTYIERDVRLIRNIENLYVFEKLLSLCAGRVGQLLNFSQLANEVGVDLKTVKSWLGILQSSYIIYLLPPFFKNFNKRIVKTPKLYFYDTGLVSYLLGIRRPEELSFHPFKGAIFENLMVLEFLKARFNRGERSNLFFWRDGAGNEVDLLIDRGLSQQAIEIKSGETIKSDFFKGLLFWGKLSGQSGGVVVYGGDAEQERSNGLKISSWQSDVLKIM
jgi:predicted AAA+ superfamily ATPase